MIVRYYFENGYSGCNQEEVEYWDNDTPSHEIDELMED